MTQAQANPAARVSRGIDQPDGTPLQLRLWGDEFANGWETEDGYTVRFDADSGYWVYAERDASGQLVDGPARAGIDPPTQPRHLRPSFESLSGQYEKLGVRGHDAPSKAAPPWASGSTNVLHILVQFPADAGDADGAQPAVNASFTAAQIQDLLFGGAATGPGNMTDYYNEISYNALNLVGTVVGPYTLANDKDDYDDGPLDAKDMVAEAIALADPDVDFNDFDNDGDGNVDNVAVIYAGNGPDNGNYNGADPDVNRLWPHASSLGAAVGVDGINAQTYYIAPELLNSAPTRRTIGVYAHEFGHKLGLPDLYDTDDSPNDSDGIGHWGLMGSGSWTSDVPGVENGESPSHMGAWCKYVLGWITPVDHTANSVSVAMPQAETNPFAVRLGDNPGGPDDWGGGSGEYWLIENRQQTGFDVGLDGCGILVWHIDESQTNNRNQGHTAGSHRLVDLEEADGLEELDITDDRGDAGDPFPGSSNVTVWDGTGTPHSDYYDGSASGFRMAVLDGCGPSMNVTFGNQPPVAQCQDVQVDADDDCLVEVAATMVDDGSFDPDGDPITLALSPAGPYGLGTTNVTLTVTDDKGESDTCAATITVVDVTPPDVFCPGDIVVECSAPGGVPADDPQLVDFFADFEAVDNCDADPSVSNDAPALFPSGCPAGTVSTVTWTAIDDSGNAAQCSANVTVIDTQPPTFDTLTVSRDVLWPPNHKMVDIVVTIEVSDLCDDDPQVTLISATSSQPDNGTGDGNTVNDIQGADIGTDDREVSLRSERRGGDMAGRKYTLTYEVADCSGNTSQGSVCVRVPHSQRGMAMAVSGFSADGTAIDLGARYFEVAIPSEIDARIYPVDRDSPIVLGFDATQLHRDRIYLGNTWDAVRPTKLSIQDLNRDGAGDLLLLFPIEEVHAILEASVDGEEVGLQFRTGAEEGDRLIRDVFTLGEPVEPPIFTDTGDLRFQDEAEVVRPVGELSIAPNPFNPRTTFSFRLDRSGRVRLVVYNLRGEVVRDLADGTLPAGDHDIIWNGRDRNGGTVASGFYFVRFELGDRATTHKVTLLK